MYKLILFNFTFLKLFMIVYIKVKVILLVEPNQISSMLIVKRISSFLCKYIFIHLTNFKNYSIK